MGNPANTNALIAMHNAPSIDPKQFTSMMRLDHDRSIAQVANKYKTSINEVKESYSLGKSFKYASSRSILL